MQRIGVVQIGKIPNNLPDYVNWLLTSNGYFLIQNNVIYKNLITFWGENGECEIVYKH
ncbi:hypothetical protein [Methanocaldococcus sp.]|uniref:hypothetical protein n=1 Tax=Methanocaldococcus sp. TaxID=2152917 RepID=UPI00262C1DC9|nr:hypothetical protein [Methanocaldococcus sp.]MCQ6254540.1 hypothetical protein [Methanocaldococcus sp.]